MVRWGALALLVTACAASEPAAELAVTDARAPAPTDTLAAAVYFTITGGAVDDTLMGITAGIARGATLHTSERNGGTRRMRRVPALAIPARGIVRLAPGGYHVMLEQLARRPVAGDTLTLTLTFRQAGVRRVAVPVVRYEDLLP